MTPKRTAWMFALIPLALAACGDDETPAPPPIFAGDVVAESRLDGKPVPLSNAVVTHLEANGTPASLNDTGTIGTDTWEIEVDATRTIGFGIVGLPDVRLRILNSAGIDVGSVRSGDAPRSITLAPGRYRVEVVNQGTRTHMAKVGWHDAVAAPGLYASVATPVWPTSHADRRNTGVGIGKGATLATHSTAGIPFATGVGVIGADGTLYYGLSEQQGSRNGLTAVSPAGVGLWTIEIGAPIQGAPAVGSDGTIYAGGSDGRLYAINHNGTLKWTYATGGTMWSSPQLAADGTVYVGSDDGNLYAINPDGTRKWAYAAGGPVRMTPAVANDGTVYAPSINGFVHAIEPATGAGKWKFSVKLFNIIPDNPLQDNTVAVGADGTIYVGSLDFNVYAINPDGSKKWSFTTAWPIQTAPAIAPDGNVVVASADGNLYKLKPDGSKVWSTNFLAPISSAIAIGADGTVYIGDDSGYMFAVDGASGQIRNKLFGPFVVCGTGIAIAADGRLYGPACVPSFGFEVFN